MKLERRTVVWLAAIIVAVNGFFPAVWIDRKSTRLNSSH